jgi:hypothetical protein
VHVNVAYIYVLPAAERLPGLLKPPLIDITVDHNVQVCQPRHFLKLNHGNVCGCQAKPADQIKAELIPTLSNVSDGSQSQIGARATGTRKTQFPMCLEVIPVGR